MVSTTAKRIRRTTEAARRAILEAAERRLIEDGPEGVRVQHIAADLGMTGAALHYHFGSREALIDSVRRYSAKRLLTDIDAILEARRKPGQKLVVSGCLAQRYREQLAREVQSRAKAIGPQGALSTRRPKSCP